MATTKTLTPTNETITIDAFQGEKPDHRHVADAETKLANAVNALDSQIGYGVPTETLNSDLNDALTPGWYLIGNSATNTPPGLSSGKLHIEYGGTTNYVRQTYYGGYNTPIYTRTRYYNNGSWHWNSWTKYADVTTGTMVVACNAGKTQISYANLPSGKPDAQGKFLQSLYQCVNHSSAAEMTTVCIDGVDLIIQTATAQNVTIRWFYFGTVV